MAQNLHDCLSWLMHLAAILIKKLRYSSVDVIIKTFARGLQQYSYALFLCHFMWLTDFLRAKKITQSSSEIVCRHKIVLLRISWWCLVSVLLTDFLLKKYLFSWYAILLICLVSTLFYSMCINHKSFFSCETNAYSLVFEHVIELKTSGVNKWNFLSLRSFSFSLFIWMLFRATTEETATDNTDWALSK